MLAGEVSQNALDADLRSLHRLARLADHGDRQIVERESFLCVVIVVFHMSHTIFKTPPLFQTSPGFRPAAEVGIPDRFSRPVMLEFPANVIPDGAMYAPIFPAKFPIHKDAEKIEAGMHETKEELQSQKEELKAQNEALQQHQAQLAEHQEKIAANKAGIDAAVARFGQLDDYYIFDEVTVNFANGKIKVDPQYNAPLLALADKAKTIEGYVIEVKGYASSVGSVALNQQLSEDRADAVTNILVQQGHVPLTRMLAPGAMGEAHQIGDDKTEKGQAENRRVVIRLLQNKGIAGV